MALFPEGTNGAVSDLANKGIKKAVNYGSAYLNSKLNFGLNYAKSFTRQYDILGILPEQWTILDESQEKAFGFDTFQSLNYKQENKVTQNPVDYELIETGDKKIAKIVIYSFTETVAKSFKEALEQADKDKTKNIIIDLRDNGGGYLDQAVAIADMFLPKDSMAK